MNFAHNYSINLPVLLETRLLIQANSGGGKSFALRRFLEQTANHVQQLVIDSEGEFATLREKFDYIIAAPHGADAVATPHTAALLARRLWESGVSAILDIYDLKAHDRQLFVKRFCESLISAPRAIWHPAMLVIDETHVFCPQVGSAEAAGAVIDVATRGRKRGLCLVGATQRLSKLHKDCAAELLNKMVGRTSLDVDVKRAADELGMSPKEAVQALRTLSPGEFFGFGPGLSATVQKLRVGPVETSHPEAGNRLAKAPPAPSPRLLTQLAKLADLQKEAEEEIQTIEALREQNRRLNKKVADLEKAGAGGISEKQVQSMLAGATAASDKALENFRAGMKDIQSTLDALLSFEAASIKPISKEVRQAQRAVPSVERPARIKPEVSSSSEITGPEQRILNALAWLESIGVSEPENVAVAFIAGYKPQGGAYQNPRGKLRSAGLIEYAASGKLKLTEEGWRLAKSPETPSTQEELHDRVMAKLSGPEQRILKPLLEHYPNGLSNEDLAERAGYAAGGGAYQNPRGRLRSLGLIDYSGGSIIARSILFP